MWIQYSWGSLTKIQMAAAVTIQKRLLTRAGFQPSRTISYAMKKYSNVFGKDQQQRAPAGQFEARRRRPAGRSRGTGRRGTPARWSSCASSTGRRWRGSTRPSPCRSPGIRAGRSRTTGRSSGRRRPGSARSRMAGRGNRGMSRGTRNRAPTTARKTAVAVAVIAYPLDAEHPQRRGARHRSGRVRRLIAWWRDAPRRTLRVGTPFLSRTHSSGRDDGAGPAGMFCCRRRRRRPTGPLTI